LNWLDQVREPKYRGKDLLSGGSKEIPEVQRAAVHSGLGKEFKSEEKFTNATICRLSRISVFDTTAKYAMLINR